MDNEEQLSRKPKAHGTHPRNWCHKSTPFSRVGFWRLFFIPYADGMKISGADGLTISIAENIR